MGKQIQLTANIKAKSRTSTANLLVPVVAYTDYPLHFLGDEPGKPAPMREVEVIGYDGDKYARIRLGNGEETVKRGYLYTDETKTVVVSADALAGLPKEW